MTFLQINFFFVHIVSMCKAALHFVSDPQVEISVYSL